MHPRISTAGHANKIMNIRGNVPNHWAQKRGSRVAVSSLLVSLTVSYRMLTKIFVYAEKVDNEKTR